MDERMTYETIREWIFNCYYSYCRTKLHDRSAWVENESELGYAYDQLENAFDLPIERLMFAVSLLILDAGRSAEPFESEIRAQIRDLLSQNDLKEMINVLPHEEMEDFLWDLKVLGIISK